MSDYDDRDDRRHPDLVRPPTDPTAVLRTAAQDFLDMLDAESEHEGVLRILLRPSVVVTAAFRAALASQADDPSGPDVEAALDDLLREFPSKRDATVRELIEKHRRPIIEAAIRADKP